MGRPLKKQPRIDLEIIREFENMRFAELAFAAENQGSGGLATQELTQSLGIHSAFVHEITEGIKGTHRPDNLRAGMIFKDFAKFSEGFHIITLTNRKRFLPAN
jgi:hypothetical protein